MGRDGRDSIDIWGRGVDGGGRVRGGCLGGGRGGRLGQGVGWVAKVLGWWGLGLGGVARGRRQETRNLRGEGQGGEGVGVFQSEGGRGSRMWVGGGSWRGWGRGGRRGVRESRGQRRWRWREVSRVELREEVGGGGGRRGWSRGRRRGGGRRVRRGYGSVRKARGGWGGSGGCREFRGGNRSRSGG